MLRHNPDKNPNGETSHQKPVELNNAYEALVQDMALPDQSDSQYNQSQYEAWRYVDPIEAYASANTEMLAEETARPLNDYTSQRASVPFQSTFIRCSEVFYNSREALSLVSDLICRYERD